MGETSFSIRSELVGKRESFSELYNSALRLYKKIYTFLYANKR
jgi:hypothetical protein